MSSHRHALIQDVIPYLDILTEHVDKFKADTSKAATVRAAAARGRVILDRYYSRTDEGSIYRIAMRKFALAIQCSHNLICFLQVLHPAFKTQYFDQHHWPDEWVEEALRLCREEWKESYRPAPSSLTAEIPPPLPPPNYRPGHISAHNASLSTLEVRVFGI